MFKKYESIENHYQQKWINRFLEWHPELAEETYIIEHKIDGANVSILVDEEGIVQWAKRSSVLSKGDNFMGINEIRGDYDELIRNLLQWKTREGVQTLQLYGELHGPGIQNRVDYGEKKKIEFFDLRLDGALCTPQRFYEIMDEVEWKLRIRALKFCSSLQEALDSNTRIRTEKGSLIEGVVIKPYYSNYYSPNGSRFVIKKKNEEFIEQSKPKKVKVQKEFRPEVQEAYTLFSSLLNKNRVFSVFSKEGEISEPSEIGKYIRLVLNDALDDFQKEISLDEFTQDEIKYIVNSQGKKIAQILKEFLKERV